MKKWSKIHVICEEFSKNPCILSINGQKSVKIVKNSPKIHVFYVKMAKTPCNL